MTDAAGGNATESFVIDVRPPSAPNALAVTATVTPSNGAAAGPPLTFIALASGGSAPYAYHWDLGPGRSAVGTVAQESYPVGYCPSPPSCALVAYLNVTDALGATITADVPISFAGGAIGSALSLLDATTATAGATPFVVWANASTPELPGGGSVLWNFGDGNTSTAYNASHEYLTPGNYTLTVTASDAFGDVVVHSRAVRVTGIARSLPQVTGGPWVRVGVAPFRANFTVHASGGAGAPYTFNWTFGDGEIGTEPSLTHIYGSGGNYTPSVVVTDAVGTPVTSSWTLVVYQNTSVAIGATPPAGTLAPGTTFTVLLRASPMCTNQSIPGCSTGLTQLSVYPAFGTPSYDLVTLDTSGNGTVTLVAPAQGGTYGYGILAASVRVRRPGGLLHPRGERHRRSKLLLRTRRASCRCSSSRSGWGSPPSRWSRSRWRRADAPAAAALALDDADRDEPARRAGSGRRPRRRARPPRRSCRPRAPPR